MLRMRPGGRGGGFGLTQQQLQDRGLLRPGTWLVWDGVRFITVPGNPPRFPGHEGRG